MLRLLEEGTQALSGFLERSNGKIGPLSTASEITDAAKLFIEIAQSWATDPAKLAESQGELVRGYLQLAGATSQRLLGAEVPPVAEPEPGDNRFKDPEWEQNPYFDFCKQTYLITMRWLDEVLQQDRRARRAHAPARRVLPEAAGQRAVALQLPA